MIHKHYITSTIFEVNGPQALYNPGCLKCILGINLSPAKKNLFVIIHFILLKQEVLTKELDFKVNLTITHYIFQ